MKNNYINTIHINICCYLTLNWCLHTKVSH